VAPITAVSSVTTNGNNFSNNAIVEDPFVNEFQSHNNIFQIGAQDKFDEATIRCPIAVSPEINLGAEKAYRRASAGAHVSSGESTNLACVLQAFVRFVNHI